MSPGAEIPKCLSIILCDDVYRDEKTKKLVIVGTFNRISAPRLPCQHSRMSVLFTLTNGRGTFDLSLTIEHAETEKALVQLSGPATLGSPMEIFDQHVEILGVEFPQAGKYCVTLKANGEQIATRPFFVEGPNHG